MEARRVPRHWIAILVFAQAMAVMGQSGGAIPTTLEGLFEPVTRRFDLPLRMGSDDLPMDHPRLKKNVTSLFPEQISLALSADPSSVWVSWITGLEPGTTYYYKCGDSSLPAMSDEYFFKTMPSPSPNAYPSRIAVVGDLEMTYANQYRTTGGQGAPCFSCSFPDAPIRESYQPRWDGWGRFIEPFTSRLPMMVIAGNHEIEPQVDGITFQSYLTRFAIPSEESRSNSSFYYSFNAGGVHFIMLGSYVDYNTTGAQYSWLMDDLHQVDRSLTPWAVAAWHAPWYNSYSSHYQEFECMRQEMQALLYQYKVGFVFNGHVHAYERMNRVYNYTLDPCGPVYITVGDGGNIKKVDVDFADDPGKRPKPEDSKPEFGGLCPLNFTSGPAKGKFCWSKQPEWSAYRESSFGHGILELWLSNIVNSTHAFWTWHRNQDTYKEDKAGDQIFIVRQPELCSPTLKETSDPPQGGQDPETASPSSSVILSSNMMWLASLLVSSFGIVAR